MSVLMSASSWTRLAWVVPEYVVLAVPVVGYGAVAAAMAVTRWHRFRLVQLPLWARALGLVLVVTAGLVANTGRREYKVGSGRADLVAFAPAWVLLGVWFSFAAVMITWAALRYPEQVRVDESRQGPDQRS